MTIVAKIRSHIFFAAFIGDEQHQFRPDSWVPTETENRSVWRMKSEKFQVYGGNRTRYRSLRYRACLLYTATAAKALGLVRTALESYSVITVVKGCIPFFKVLRRWMRVINSKNVSSVLSSSKFSFNYDFFFQLYFRSECRWRMIFHLLEDSFFKDLIQTN